MTVADDPGRTRTISPTRNSPRGTFSLPDSLTSSALSGSNVVSALRAACAWAIASSLASGREDADQRCEVTPDADFVNKLMIKTWRLGTELNHLPLCVFYKLLKTRMARCARLARFSILVSVLCPSSPCQTRRNQGVPKEGNLNQATGFGCNNLIRLRRLLYAARRRSRCRRWCRCGSNCGRKTALHLAHCAMHKLKHMH